MAAAVAAAALAGGIQGVLPTIRARIYRSMEVVVIGPEVPTKVLEITTLTVTSSLQSWNRNRNLNRNQNQKADE
jgi:hypothetical protein